MAPTVQETLRECIAMLGAALPSARETQFLGAATPQEIAQFRAIVNDAYRGMDAKQNSVPNYNANHDRAFFNNRVKKFQREHPRFDIHTDGGGLHPDWW